MKKILLWGLGLALFTAPAMADKAGYCQAYARDFSDQATTDKAEWQHKFQIALDACLGQSKKAAITPAVQTPVVQKRVVAAPAPKVEKPVVAKPASATLLAGTPEWNSYCAKKYTSFDAKTGMYQSKTGVPRKCLVTSDFKG